MYVWMTQLAAEEFTKTEKLTLSVANESKCWNGPATWNKVSGCPAPPNHAAPLLDTLKAPWPSNDLDPQPYPPRIAWTTKVPSGANGYLTTSWQEVETSHQGIVVPEITLPKLYFWCDSFNHCSACFLCAFVWRLAASSNSWKAPCSNTARRSDESIFLVKGSASCSEVGIHLKKQCSMHLSLIRRTSNVVRYSSHDGIARRLTRSYRDLQSVTTTAACIWRNASGGLLHWNSGMINVPHSKRHHPILSTLRDMEKASADNVDLTTLEIFLDDHDKGLMGALLLSWRSGVVANTKVPWKDANCFGLANDASPNTTCVSFGEKWIWNTIPRHMSAGPHAKPYSLPSVSRLWVLTTELEFLQALRPRQVWCWWWRIANCQWGLSSWTSLFRK